MDVTIFKMWRSDKETLRIGFSIVPNLSITSTLLYGLSHSKVEYVVQNAVFEASEQRHVYNVY